MTFHEKTRGVEEIYPVYPEFETLLCKGILPQQRISLKEKRATSNGNEKCLSFEMETPQAQSKTVAVAHHVGGGGVTRRSFQAVLSRPAQIRERKKKRGLRRSKSVPKKRTT